MQFAKAIKYVHHNRGCINMQKFLFLSLLNCYLSFPRLLRTNNFTRGNMIVHQNENI